MSDGFTLSPIVGLNVGDRVHVSKGLIYRKWWQFWRPEIVGVEDRTFVVTRVYPNNNVRAEAD